MKTYLVGGAVRDKMLGLEVKDRDYVVVGATPEEMVEKGFKPIGADFPVFLHPKTKEEYALARTERKSGRGYKGFTVYSSPDVTLEQDLERRDLTINAMAEDEDGSLIDPFNGAQDLREGRLRHVSPAFAEDPVRILRVARFAARYAKWGFRLAHSTTKLMRSMVEDGEVDALVPERVWAETERALGEPKPSRFIHVLRACGALQTLFPEIEALFGVPQPEAHHPEVDTGEHILLVIDQAAELSRDPQVVFAALVHDFGKGITPEEEWPRHIGHEGKGAKLVKEFCQRFRVPNEFRDLGMLTARYHSHCHRVFELKPSTLVKTLESLDGFRRPERIHRFVLACEADYRGRSGYEDKQYEEGRFFEKAFETARAVNSADIAKALQAENKSGEQIAEAIRKERTKAIEALKQESTK